MTHTIRTGRQLDVEAIAQSKNKVTLGFKCEPQLKMDLAMEAERYGMSLSEYTEVIVGKRHNQTKPLNSNEETQSLKAKLSFYENDFLKKALVTYKGRIVDYKDSFGHDRRIQIDKIEDVFTVIINKAKLSV
jgi:hypothetical protein